MLERSQSDRLISDGMTDGEITLMLSHQESGTGDDHPVLVGNPFMAHLDFHKFYQGNSSQIADQYKLAYDTAVTRGKVNDLHSYLWNGGISLYETEDPLRSAGTEGLIAPMQSFIVTPLTASPVLKVSPEMMTTSVRPENTFRAGGSEPSDRLDISAIRGNRITKTLLLYNRDAVPEYRPEEDSRKLFPASDPIPVLVYTRSKDGYALAINTVGGLNEPVAVGIRTSVAGEITLRFSGMESFGNGTRICLHDTHENRVIDLSRQTEYTFMKEDGEPYLENRFFLTFPEETASGAPSVSGISVTGMRKEICIISGDGSPIGRIRIFDMQGRCLLDTVSPSSAYFYPVRQPGILIVRAGGKATKLRIDNE
jgi:hypothetical protein